MKLHELFEIDPRKSKLANQGVAKVNEHFAEQEETLRFELSTFVCEGKYEQGLDQILSNAMTNHDANREQAGVWISGYFGSGKSHLAKMLRVLWTDYTFSDGASARGIVKLPSAIQAHLKELEIHGKRAGGLHAASGTLNSSASGHVRMAVAGIVSTSLGMPDAWHKAQFVMWLRERGLEDKLKKYVQEQGGNWQFELNNIYVSKYIAPGLIELDKTLGNDIQQVRSLISAQFPQRQDISNEELIGFVEHALRLHYKGQIPFTLIVIDEVQQYAGTDHHRAVMVQEVVEALCSHFKGRLLIVATGQSALRETPNLQRLMGRFPVSIQLSETDVETVTRKVLLAKLPTAIPSVEETVRKYEGEIARQLEGTAAGWLDSFRVNLVKDYPLLPGRRRLWDVIMQSVDTTGTGSQLRSQLAIVQKSLALVSDEELGFVVPGDCLYDLIASDLLQLSSLPRSNYEEIQRLDNGDSNSRFKARILKLIFLLNQIRSENPKGKGLIASQEIIIDLLISRLDGERNELTRKVPEALQELLEENLIQKLPSGEYRLQTPEGQAWVQEFQKQEAALRHSPAWLDTELRSKINNMVLKYCKGIQEIPHGQCNIKRKVEFSFDSQPPKGSGLAVWVQNGRDSDLQLVKNESVKAGASSTVAFAFIPLWNRDELERALIELKAVTETIGIKGIPVNDEGRNAKQAMENRRDEAFRKVELLITDSLNHASVFAGGGIEIGDSSIDEKIKSVLLRALPVLFPKFDEADHPSWGKAYEKAIQGQPDALRIVGHSGDIDTHPVCRQILGFIGSSGKKGDEIKKHFMNGQYGWEQEAIETALVLLLLNGKIKVINGTSKKPVTINNWERKQLSSYEFIAESIVLSASDLIKVRKLIQNEFGKQVQPQQESSRIREILDEMYDLAKMAGGDPPAPPVPKSDLLDRIRNETGNAQLRMFLDNGDELVKMKTQWKESASKIAERMPRWSMLKELLEQGKNLLSFKELENEAEAINNARLLLIDPDPLEKLIEKASDLLRTKVNSTYQQLQTVYDQEFEKLSSSPEWNKLKEEKQAEIIYEFNLEVPPEPSLGSPEEIIDTLRKRPLNTLGDLTDAVPGRFRSAYNRAVSEISPKARPVELPKKTIATETELDLWINEIRQIVLESLKDGPVII